ncbi:MAG: helix-turn-helix domain-containing protein [Phycisphaerales bacterium]|nr:helix-turn-helix transcriptional regulator [Planctomycetota bacterium]MCH8509899.1 helix-turn-helix domain-containing protein [Phycisphaerales bacterium]
MRPDTLTERLRIITGGQTIREVAEMVDMNHETVRRYLSGHAPSTEFLAQICDKYGVSGNWLLLGKGPATIKAVRKQALETASEEELMGVLGSKLQSIELRIENLELAVKRYGPRSKPGGREAASQKL